MPSTDEMRSIGFTLIAAGTPTVSFIATFSSFYEDEEWGPIIGEVPDGDENMKILDSVLAVAESNGNEAAAQHFAGLRAMLSMALTSTSPPDLDAANTDTEAFRKLLRTIPQLTVRGR